MLGSWIDEEMNAHHEVSNIGGKSRVMSFKQALSYRYGFKASSYTFKAQKIRYSCSLQDTGMVASGALAHVHFKHATGNNFDEIRMGVHVGGRKLKADSMRVADILLHEIIHTLCPHAGHKGAFRAIALKMGLTGKMTATVATEDLSNRIKAEIVDIVGKYPHAAVQLVPRGQRGKGSRSIKCQCHNADCLFTMRTTRKWIIKAGFNLACPICHTDEMIIEGNTGEEE
mgnify:FL=1